MDTQTIGISVIVAVLVVAGVYWYLSSTAGTPTSITTIQGSIEDGRKSAQSKQILPRSLDQKEGIAFSYTCWVKIDDFAYRYGQQKVVFVKGTPDLKTSCPALLVDANTNTLLVKIDTYGATETIPISNIPAKKWVHVGIVADQDSVDVYINGTLYIHHTLIQIPKQNNLPVHTGVGGGFDGKIADLKYYSYFMTADEIRQAMSASPVPDPSETAVITPPYFDISWWTSRRS